MVLPIILLLFKPVGLMISYCLVDILTRERVSVVVLRLPLAHTHSVAD